MTSNKSATKKIKYLLNSHSFHLVIVSVLLTDCIFISFELIIESIEISNECNHKSFINQTNSTQTHLTLKYFDSFLKWSILIFKIFFLTELTAKFIFLRNFS